ncbi:MAG: hypothetical protein GY846_12985 [Deltaproteobacteria bacterium]|nr:hypothetical protein [Deltaproteobacteria bacterium]
MVTESIPCHQGKPILGDTPQQAFRVLPEEFLHGIKQQFTERELALRELGQNSQDADASTIRVDYGYDEATRQMTLTFLDDGCGMDRKTILAHYLRFFDSSKEEDKTKVGQWSLGRVSMLCYDPELVEIHTLPATGFGYRLVIHKDLSGALFELDRETAESLIQGPHGTHVRIVIPVESSEMFVEAVKKANQSMKKEICWIKPATTVTTIEIKDGRMVFGTEKINREMKVPGRYSTELNIQMASGTGVLRCALGLQNGEDSGLAPITLCNGGIPIERPSGLPWTGFDDFAMRGMHVILDSHDFRTNIGRNVVYRETDFMLELLPKFFKKVVLDHFVTPMAALLTQPAFQIREYQDALRLLMADVCIKSTDHFFQIPEAVLSAPFIQSFVSFRPYCLKDLDQAEGPIYYTSEKPDILGLKNADETDAQIVCLCVSDLPYEFRSFLQERYGTRFKEKEQSAVVLDEDADALGRLSRRINGKLGALRLWHEEFYAGLESVGHRPYLPGEITVGRFVRYDGEAETRITTQFSKSPRRIYLNYNSPHMRNLIELLLQDDGAYETVAAHFIMREIFFDPDLKFSITQREMLLSNDLSNRFHTGPFPECLDGENEEIRLLESLLSGFFKKNFLEL